MNKIERTGFVRVLFSVTIALASFVLFSRVVKADGSVEINATNFPDENFRSYVSDEIDTNDDGYLDSDEIQNATTIDCWNKNISDLKGIEYFVNLKTLYCNNNQLTTLDVSNNTALIELYCDNNQLTTLDVSNNTALIELYCDNNQLTTLDVSKNTALKELDCYNNQLTTLDVSKNTALTVLSCYYNQLTTLDVSKNTALEYLLCSNNPLTTLDVSKNTALKELNCYKNQLTTLDVSKNTALRLLVCDKNQLTELDVSKNTALNSLSCSDNQLTTLDVSKNTALGYLSCENNQLTTLDVSKNTSLYLLDCRRNLLSAPPQVGDNVVFSYDPQYVAVINSTNFPDENFRLYVSDEFDNDDNGYLDIDEIQNATIISLSGSFISDLKGIEYFVNLTYLRCSYNELTTLDVSKNTALEYLSCGNNQLTTLDVSKNTALEYLYCSNNQLTTLDVSKNTALTELDCGNNQLITLDVSKNTALEYLSCHNNQLTTLDLSKNTALEGLSCSYNQLTTLDVSNNTALIVLICKNNQLTTLDVSNNTVLKEFGCSENQLTTLDLSKNTALIGVDCSCNYLSEKPQVGENVELIYDPQYVAAIDETNFPDENFRSYVSDEFDTNDDGYLVSDEIQNATIINLSESFISDLKGIEYFVNLKSLYCNNNQLTTLDVSKNTALEYLSCENNQLTTLDVSKNTVLEFLYCSYNQLTTLDVSKNTALEYLFCFNNQLTTLDVSKNTALTVLSCYYNQLTTLDVSKNTALKRLYCDYNQLTTLDVSKNTALNYLICNDNQLTTLDVSKNTELEFLDCCYNFISAKPQVSDNVEYNFDPQYKTAAIITQPQDYTGIVGDTATFIVEAEGKDLTYKWQTYSNGTWKNSSLPGSKTDTLSFGITTSRDGYKFRCVITDAIGNKVISNTVVLHAITPVAITTQPEDYTGAVGSTATFTVKATGTELKYQWQAYSNGAWKNSSFTGAKTATLSVPVTAARDGYKFRCVITDKYNQTATSNTAVLHVATPVAITTQPKDYTGAVGSTATFTVKATGTELKYQWQAYSNGAWKNSSFTGAKTATLSVPVTAAERDGYKFRCVITDKYNQTATSNTAVLHVAAPIAITTQPKDYTGAVGSTAEFKVKATGTDLKYQWQSYKNGKWVNSSLPGYNTATLSVGVTASRDGYQFRCVITDKYNQTVTSNTATLNVATPVAITSQPKDFTGPVGSTAEFKVKATGTGLKYQWQTYKSGAWKNSSFTGSTTATLSVDVTASRDGYKFRCVITDSLGNTVTSKTATLHVDNTHTSTTNVVTVTTPSNLGLIDADEEQAIPEPEETEKIVFDTEDSIETVITNVDEPAETAESEDAAITEHVDNIGLPDSAEDNVTGLTGKTDDLDDVLTFVDEDYERFV